MKIKVTVGMCVKNCEATVEETICSLVNQHYPYELMEIIIVDGNSKDKTLPILKSNLSNIGIQLKTYQDEGKGLGVARQIVVDNAEGEYIVWVDGDVILTTNFLRKQVEFMDQNPKVGAAQGQWGRLNRKTLAGTLDNLSAFITSIIYYSESAGSSIKSLGIAGGGIFRVEAIKHVGGFDKHIKGAAEDMDLTARMRAAGWSLSISRAKLYHIYKETWSGLWNKYFWWGYGDHYLNCKHKWLVILWQKVPIVALAAGFRRSICAYKKTQQKTSFLLPFHNYFRAIAWCSGYIKSHLNGYGHESK